MYKHQKWAFENIKANQTPLRRAGRASGSSHPTILSMVLSDFVADYLLTKPRSDSPTCNLLASRLLRIKSS